MLFNMFLLLSNAILVWCFYSFKKTRDAQQAYTTRRIDMAFDLLHNHIRTCNTDAAALKLRLSQVELNKAFKPVAIVKKLPRKSSER